HPTIVFVDLENRRDVVVVKHTEHPRFIEKHRGQLFLIIAREVERLDHDVTLEPTDAFGAREIDQSHAARRKLGDELVAADPLESHGTSMIVATPTLAHLLRPVRSSGILGGSS